MMMVDFIMEIDINFPEKCKENHPSAFYFKIPAMQVNAYKKPNTK